MVGFGSLQSSWPGASVERLSSPWRAGGRGGRFYMGPAVDSGAQIVAMGLGSYLCARLLGSVHVVCDAVDGD